MNHKVANDSLYTCVSKQALRHYESDLFNYAKGEHSQSRCLVCGHKLDLSAYAPTPSKFDLLKQAETTPCL